MASFWTGYAWPTVVTVGEVLAVVVPLIFVLSLASPDNLFLLDWAPVSYDWAKWLPGGLLVEAVASADGSLSLRWTWSK